MAFKFIAVCALFAVASAGLVAPVAYSAAPAVSHFSYTSPVVSYGQSFAAQQPAITSQSSNILRSYGNLGQVSTYSKTIDTPFSSVRKSDVRVSNPGLTTYAAAAPVLAHTAYAAPIAHATYAAAPVLKSAPLLTRTAYAAPLAHATYAAPLAHATYAAPLAHATYAAPLAHATYAATPVVKATHGLGVAYSAAPVVSHMTYSNGLGITYGW